MRLPFRTPLSSIIGQYRKSHDNLQLLYRNLWLDIRSAHRQCFSLKSHVTSYNDILKVLGGTEHAAHKTKRTFIIGIFLNLLLSVVCVVASLSVESLFIYIQLWCIVMISLLTIITLCWKIWVLQNEKFVPFWSWLVGRW